MSDTFTELCSALKQTRSQRNGITLNQVAHAITCHYRKEEVDALIRELEIEYESQDEIQEDTTSMEEKLVSIDEDNEFDTIRENAMV